MSTRAVMRLSSPAAANQQLAVSLQAHLQQRAVREAMGSPPWGFTHRAVRRAGGLEGHFVLAECLQRLLPSWPEVSSVEGTPSGGVGTQQQKQQGVATAVQNPG